MTINPIIPRIYPLRAEFDLIAKRNPKQAAKAHDETSCGKKNQSREMKADERNQKPHGTVARPAPI